MSAVNTDEGTILEALNDKSDRDLHNVDTTAKADAVIDYQIPTAENNYTWYRKYKSGWVEQGGIEPITTTATTTEYSLAITLPVQMADGNYTGNCGANFSGGSAWNGPYKDGTSTATVVHFNGWVQGTSTITVKSWRVEGMAAA